MNKQSTKGIRRPFLRTWEFWLTIINISFFCGVIYYSKAMREYEIKLINRVEKLESLLHSEHAEKERCLIKLSKQSSHPGATDEND